jgi:hypothetical protein
MLRQDSSLGILELGLTLSTTSPNKWPSSSPLQPARLNAYLAFGLA